MPKDTFRSQYRDLSDEEKGKIILMKAKAQELLDLIDAQEGGSGARERACAITKLEECVMWATKSFTA